MNYVVAKMNRIKKTYDSLDVTVKASVWFTVCNVLQKTISFLCMPIFTRIMTPGEYGVYTLFLSDETFLKLICTINVYGEVFLNGLLVYKKKRDEYISSLIGFCMFTTSAFAIVVFFGRESVSSLTGLSVPIIFLMFIDVWSSVVFAFWLGEQKFDYKYVKLVILTAIISISVPFLGVPMVITSNDKSYAKVFSSVITTAFVGVFLFYHYYKRSHKLYSRECWGYAFKNSVPLLPHYASLVVLQQADRVMIGKMNGADKAAIYGMAYTIANIIAIIVVAINDSLYPFTLKAIKDNRNEDVSKRTIPVMYFVGFMCVLMMMLGPEILMVFAPKEYFEAVDVIPAVAGSVYYMYQFQMYRNISFVYSKKIQITVCSVLCAVMNIVLNYIFIGAFGYIAAGYTTIVSYFFASLFHFVLQKHITKREGAASFYRWRSIAFPNILFIVSIILVILLYGHNVLRYTLLSFIIVAMMVFRKRIIYVLKGVKKSE